MGSVNKVTLIGNLAADPEMRHTQSGNPVTNIRMATNERWTDKDGEKQEKTEWHRVVAFGKLAEICNTYLKKGRQAYVEGKIQTREWDDKEGIKRYTTEVVARDVVFLGGREESSQGGNSPKQQPLDDDYPF